MKNPLAKKQWKAVLSKPLATSATKAKAKAPAKTHTSKSPAKRRSVLPAPVSEAIALFQRYDPDAHCALNFETPFQLLVATILSAQCTDERVNQVTPELFRRFPKASDLSQAPIEEIEGLIRSVNFFRNKARNLKKCAERLVELHHGEVPADLEALVELAGVGRKTAHVVLGNAFRVSSGVVVDTHVCRLANRLGWTRSLNAVVIEQDLNPLIPREHWIQIAHWLISHGRSVCKARKPACDTCFLFELCPKVLKNS